MNTNPHFQYTPSTKPAIDKLQELLQAELSAVDTYELALRSVSHVGLHHTLQEILISHSRRMERIRERLSQLGADPATGSGVWGTFAKAMQAGADLFGDRAAVAALEEGEDHALKLYKEGLDKVDNRTWKFIDNDLRPEQMRTHDLCRRLKEYMANTN
jgi:demethoxyubiquinone hydroxylase (CLK1/Coq7/Cat5 family)